MYRLHGEINCAVIFAIAQLSCFLSFSDAFYSSFAAKYCVHVIQAESDGNSEDSKKSRVTRKHVIIAVTCAVVVAMVIAGVVVGVKFFLDSTNDIVKVATGNDRF